MPVWQPDAGPIKLPDCLFLFIQLLYSLFTLLLWAAWRRIGRSASSSLTPAQPLLSVVIAVRDEEDNIGTLLQDLDKQSCASDAFEVIVVDDHSADRTARIVEETAPAVSFPLRLLHLHNYLAAGAAGAGYKKEAIRCGVEAARGEWIVLTDGDCRVGSGWLKSIATEVTGNSAQMISGPVTFHSEASFFQKMQTVEFASLIGSGAATLQLGLPTMCNAANLAFSKRAFQDVNGYAGTAHTATGDDLFLMHKIHTRFPGCVRFLKERESIVYTRAKADWQSFYQQRKRWASKWNLYQDRRVTVLAVLVFLSNAALLAGITGYFLDALTGQALLAGIVLRFASEFLFLGSVLLFLKKPAMLRWIFPVQMVYFLYVTFFAIMAQKRGYVWKGRKLY